MLRLRRTMVLWGLILLGCGGGGGGGGDGVVGGPIVIETATLVADSQGCSVRGDVQNNDDVPCGASLRFKLFNVKNDQIGAAFVHVDGIPAEGVANYDARAHDNITGADLACGPIDHFTQAVVSFACPSPPP